MVANLGGDGTQMRLVGWAADGFPIYSAYGLTDPKDTASPLKKLRSSWQIKKGSRDGGPGGKFDGTFTADFEFVPESGDLDECNGRFEVTPEFPQGTYAYHITEEFPWISRSWKGTPDASFNKRMGPGPGGHVDPAGLADARADRRRARRLPSGPDARRSEERAEGSSRTQLRASRVSGGMPVVKVSAKLALGAHASSPAHAPYP